MLNRRSKNQVIMLLGLMTTMCFADETAVNRIDKDWTDLRTMNAAGVIDTVLCTANELTVLLDNTGHISSPLSPANSGIRWPEKGLYTLNFGQSLCLGGLDENGQLRMIFGDHDAECAGGVIDENGAAMDAADSRNRIFSLGKGFPEVSPESWPSDLGAPTGPGGEAMLFGEQMHWWAINDLDSTRHLEKFGKNPIGVEIQFTVFGFDSIPGLENVLFTKKTGKLLSADQILI